MKVKIIVPSSKELPPHLLATIRLIVPVVPTYLAALAPEDIDFRLVDMALGDEIGYNEQYDLVGITVRTPLADIAYEIGDEFIRRGVPVALGGPHVTVFPLEASQHATTVVVGEAENTWRVLLQDLNNGQVKQFYVGGPFNTDNLPGTVYHKPQRPSLVGLPHLRRDLFPDKRYRMDSVFTSRGCPFGCTFCPLIFLHGPSVRHRPIEEVVAEVDELGPLYFNMDDSVVPAYDQQYYLDLYSELSGLKTKRQWCGAGSLDAVNQPAGRELLKRAADSGLVFFSAGLESVNKGGLEQSGAWRKLGAHSSESYSLDRTRRAIQIVQDAGITVMGQFILGFDLDTPDIFERTLDFCDEMNIIPIIGILTPMPGAVQYQEFEKAGRLLPGIKWTVFDSLHLLFKHPTFRADQIERGLAEVMKEAYSMGRILRREWQEFKRLRNLSLALLLLFTQLDIRKATREWPAF